jgi:hypothetical protein
MRFGKNKLSMVIASSGVAVYRVRVDLLMSVGRLLIELWVI